MSKDVVLCKDCKYFEKKGFWGDMICHNDSAFYGEEGGQVAVYCEDNGCLCGEKKETEEKNMENEDVKFEEATNEELKEAIEKIKEKVKERSVLDSCSLLTHSTYTSGAMKEINAAIDALDQLGRKHSYFGDMLSRVDHEVLDLIDHVDYCSMANRIRHVRSLVFGSMIDWEYVEEALNEEE